MRLSASNSKTAVNQIANRVGKEKMEKYALRVFHHILWMKVVLVLVRSAQVVHQVTIFLNFFSLNYFILLFSFLKKD